MGEQGNRRALRKENEMKISKKLESACSDGLEFIRTCKSMKKAWETCKYPTWLFWTIRILGYNDSKQLILLACKIACDTPLADGRYTYELLTDLRIKEAIEAAILYAYSTPPDDAGYLYYVERAARNAAEIACNSESAWNLARSAQCDMIREFISWEDIEKLL
jgi:hypothetical protein